MRTSHLSPSASPTVYATASESPAQSRKSAQPADPDLPPHKRQRIDHTLAPRENAQWPSTIHTTAPPAASPPVSSLHRNGNRIMLALRKLLASRAELSPASDSRSAGHLQSGTLQLFDRGGRSPSTSTINTGASSGLTTDKPSIQLMDKLKSAARSLSLAPPRSMHGISASVEISSISSRSESTARRSGVDAAPLPNGPQSTPSFEEVSSSWPARLAHTSSGATIDNDEVQSRLTRAEHAVSPGFASPQNSPRSNSIFADLGDLPDGQLHISRNVWDKSRSTPSSTIDIDAFFPNLSNRP